MKSTTQCTTCAKEMITKIRKVYHSLRSYCTSIRHTQFLGIEALANWDIVLVSSRFARTECRMHVTDATKHCELLRCLCLSAVGLHRDYLFLAQLYVFGGTLKQR